MVNTPENIKVQNLLSIDTFTKSFKVNISWDAVPGATSYRVYRNWVPYGTFRLVGEVAVTSLIDSPPFETVAIGLATGIDGEWYYRVTAKDGSSESAASFPQTYEKLDAFSSSPFGDEVVDGLTVGTYTASNNDITDYPDNEGMEFYFDEIRRRDLWLVQQDGEDVLLVKRKIEGEKCPYWQDDTHQCEFPLGNPTGEDACYNTGIIGGYHDPVRIKARIVPAMKGVNLFDSGMRPMRTPRSWTIWTPRLSNWDFLVLRDGRRIEITNLTRNNFRGIITHQYFDLNESSPNPNNMLYKVPINNPLSY